VVSVPKVLTVTCDSQVCSLAKEMDGLSLLKSTPRKKREKLGTFINPREIFQVRK
jgi:hypothetical protein